jgi:hypothetical protein
MQDFTTPTNASVTAGLLTREQIAAEFRCSERTIIRREHAGMPVIRLGHAVRLYDPATVRAWLLSHEYRHDVPKRGRPTKRAA